MKGAERTCSPYNERSRLNNMGESWMGKNSCRSYHPQE
jgi:hypothetical protein